MKRKGEDVKEEPTKRGATKDGLDTEERATQGESHVAKTKDNDTGTR